MVGWLVGWTGWLVDRLTGWLVGWLAGADVLRTVRPGYHTCLDISAAMTVRARQIVVQTAVTTGHCRAPATWTSGPNSSHHGKLPGTSHVDQWSKQQSPRDTAGHQPRGPVVQTAVTTGHRPQPCGPVVQTAVTTGHCPQRSRLSFTMTWSVNLYPSS